LSSSAVKKEKGSSTQGALFVPGPARALTTDEQRDVDELNKEIIWLSGRNMHNKAVRKYKNLRKTGAFPTQEGFSAVLQCCARGKIGAVADKIVLDYVAASKEASSKEASGKDKAPAWSVPLSDFKLGLEACAEGSRPVEALIICDAMTEVGVLHDAQCFSLALRSCVHAPSHVAVEELARGVMRQVRAAKHIKNPGGEYYGFLLQVLVRAKRFPEAVACFDLVCLDEEFKPQPEHYLAAMKAAAATKDDGLVKSLLGEVLMDETRFKDKLGPLMEIAAKSCAHSNNWRLAVKLLDKAPAPRSYDAHHSVIASCGRARNVKLTLELLDRLKGEGYKPNRATYNAILHACSASGEVGAARAILEEMSENNIRLNVVTYNIALNSRAKLGDARGAINLLSEMEAAGIEPTVVSFATAINAAAQYNSSSLAATLMESMAPLKVEPNAYVFTAALAACENDPDDNAASTAAMKIVDEMARVESVRRTLPTALVTRMAAQARRIMGRDLSVRDLNHLVDDEQALGVALRGRQESV